MTDLIFSSIARIFSFLKELRVQRYLAIALTGILMLSMPVNIAQNDQSLGERFRERMDQMDRNTERPKTTGDFLNEVEGDVPLGERINNTVRDSAEAFKEFGSEYGIGAQESARNVKDKAAEAGNNLTR
ncbi:MAG: hypothetical protein Kow00121_38110 [Elainellaceae cyanobacterium]